MLAAEALSRARFETLEVGVSDAVLTIEISRPKALNALSQQVFADLKDVIIPLREKLGNPVSAAPDADLDWSIRGIIITGAGEKSFIAGGDIAEMSTMTVEDTRRYTAASHEITSWLETLPVPVVAAVNGYALGGGCETALACDLIFASENAVFGQPEVQLGLIPGFGGTVRLQQIVGPQVARDLIFTGRKIDAAEAQRLGLVARVYPTIDELLAGAKEFLQECAALSPLAVASAKRTMRNVASLPTDDGLVIETEAFAECFTTEDMREGTSAFVEKRTPRFPGR